MSSPPLQSPSPQTVYAMLSRQSSVPAAGKPSPYPTKAQPHDGEAVRAGIGGPPKRRESMSGMGNNLRSHQPAGLGRSVAKSSTPVQGSPRQSLPREDPRPVCRRGSLGTAAAITADASRYTAGPTVFPTNRGYAAQGMRQLPSPSPPSQTGQSPLRVRIVHRAHSVASDRRTNPQSSPGSAGLDIGSPVRGDILDIVGSPSRPSVIYASADRGSEIGGGASGKLAMQEKPGLGSKYGKDWMADRPSGIGAPAPQDKLPESGLARVLRSLSISRKEKDTGAPQAP